MTTMTTLKNAMTNADATFEQDLLVASARELRQTLPSAKNAAYSVQFQRGVADRKAEIEKLQDKQTVELAALESRTRASVRDETDTLHALVRQVEESRTRLRELEQGRITQERDLRNHYSAEIAAARRAVRAFEVAAVALGTDSEVSS